MILLGSDGTSMSDRLGICGVLCCESMKKDGSGALVGAGCVAGGCGFLFFRSTVTSDRPDLVCAQYWATR
jgi:hypothetical protein